MPPKKGPVEALEPVEVETTAEYLSLQMEVEALKEQVKSLQGDAFLLSAERDRLKKDFETLSAQSFKWDDCVCLSGRKYAILHKGDVRDFFEDIRKRNIPEDAYCVAVLKKG